MKKSKLKSLVKTARKQAKKDIKSSLITELREIAGRFGQESKKIRKDIEKGSNQLAKKLSKDIKIDKSAILENRKENTAEQIVEVVEVNTPASN